MTEFLAEGPVQQLIFFLGTALAFLSVGYLCGRARGGKSGGNGTSEFGNDAAILKLVVEHAHEGLIMQDIYGHIEWSNPAYSRITGYSAEEIRGRRPQEFVLVPENQLFPEEIENFKYDLTKYRPGVEELILNRRKNGEHFWNQLTFAMVEGKTPEEAKIILICRDVTSQVEHMKELEVVRNRLKYQAEHDDLTGVANRARLSSYLQERVSTATEAESLIGILHIDLDRFKDVNDSHGHGAGDAVLRHTAEVLTSVLGDKGLVARIGGDEFLAVVSEPRGPEEMETIGREILEGLAKPIKVDHQNLTVGGSVGLVLADGTKASASELINRADLALYEAKKSGRGRVAWYTEALGAAHRHKRMTMAQLDQDLETGALTLLLEPQYSLERQQIVGYEALARWLHPSEGLVDPVRLLSSQEDCKRIAQIERFALSRGILEVKRLREAADHPFILSVNLTEASLKDPGVPGLISQLSEENELPSGDIVIELDEGIIRFDDPDSAAWDLGRFSDIGCRIALDMFGSGHGGAGQLLHLKADGLKISPVLVEAVSHGANQQQLVESIIGLAGNLGLQVSAVGVDTPEQAEILKRFGCSVVQGKVVGKPLSPREAEIHMRELAPQAELQ